MTEKQAKCLTRKQQITYASIGAVCLAIAVMSGVFHQQIARFVADLGKPSFVVSESVEGWWSSGNHHPSLDDVDGNYYENAFDQLPVADLSIHQGQNKNDIENAHCFVMYAYFDGQVDIEAERQAKRNGIVYKTDLIGVADIGTAAFSIDTPDGIKQGSLYKYEISDRSGYGAGMMEGMADGFVQLRNGYIHLRGVCRQASQLDELQPVLESVKLQKGLWG